MNESKHNTLIVDVSMVQNSTELHYLLKNKLEFPDFFGGNWDAFWDAITGLVELPEILVFKGWRNIEERLPRDSRIVVDLFKDYNEQDPYRKCRVVYE